MRKVLFAVCAVTVAIMAAAPAGAVGFQDLESQVQEFTLPNGLKFVVLERHDAPVFSFRTYVDAGGVDEVPGITGVAHMFEHMAFKGTTTIGTKDIAAETEAMNAVDAAWDAVADEMDKGFKTDPDRLAQLQAEFKAARDAAREYVVSNEFSKILEENGVVGMNAGTFFDWTQYFYSLPSNRLELWARLEGDRLTNPVLREYYLERDVVYEERRMQESSPTGRLFQDWIGNSFSAHPYGIGGVIGHSSDVKRITRADAQAFFNRNYVASNMTVAVVGDVKFAEVKKLAEKYFSGVHSGPNPPPVRTVEPRHDAEVRVIREEDAQPIVLVGYHIPGRLDPNWFDYELLGDIMGAGRSSRLYKRLVKEDELAVQAGAGAGFLGTKYPTLLIVQAVLAKDVEPAELEAALYDELARLSEEGPTAEELQKVKTMNRASFVRGLRSNNGLAGELAQHDQLLGDWRTLFDTLDQIDAVTVEDVKNAAQEALRPGNRVVGILTKPTS
jgi:predicted Zn-dependent peptidase